METVLIIAAWAGIGWFMKYMTVDMFADPKGRR